MPFLKTAGREQDLPGSIQAQDGQDRISVQGNTGRGLQEIFGYEVGINWVDKEA